MVHPGAEAGQHGLDDGLEVQAGLGVQLRGEADLGVHDPVFGQVLYAFAGHALERLRRLHHRHRVGEALEVAHEVLAEASATNRRPSSSGPSVGRPA